MSVLIPLQEQEQRWKFVSLPECDDPDLVYLGDKPRLVWKT